MTLSLSSEPFTATGNIAGEGLKRLLGRPPLGLLQTFLREGIQNVIDAAIGSSGPRILVRVRTLGGVEIDILRDQVFGELPLDDRAAGNILKSLNRSGLRVLELCDFNTIGLAGPTRADEPVAEGEPQNFVNFLRNVGAARGISHTGGTYGYGKSSLYAMSKCSTILVDSETVHRSRPERRFMACHLGGAFEAKPARGKARRFTGRHWWGVTGSDGEIGPLTGRKAAALSGRLGLEDRGEDKTGTSIVVLDPRLESCDPADLSDEITEAILWNFWPRMMRSTPAKRRLQVYVEIEGRRERVRKPEDMAPFALMAQAMDKVRAKSPDITQIWCGAPKKRLGYLALAQGFREERRGALARRNSVVPPNLSHIALMRPVELVVKYVEGDALADSRFEWAGVFVCSDDTEVESAFASAEPPAHDDWMPTMLDKGHAKTYVNVALRKINEVARTHATPVVSQPDSAEAGPSLASTAVRMGRLLGAVSGEGPGPGKKRPPRERGTRKGLAVSQPRFLKLDIADDGEAIAVFEAEVKNDGSAPEAKIVAAPVLVMDGGATDTSDLPSAFLPRLVSLSMKSARPDSKGDGLILGAAQGLLRIHVSVPGEAAVTVKLAILAGDER